jgi:putative hydrolase of the HAD superfamily
LHFQIPSDKRNGMSSVKAIGFDFFNTLITVDPGAMTEAFDRLFASLQGSGLSPEKDFFKKVYRESAIGFMAATKVDGRETHNRFWISAALEALGLKIAPEDDRIANAVEAYFSAFYDYCRVIPGTKEMLARFNGKYRLGLLSNFTHAPAAVRLLELTGLESFFDIILISGAIGFRKPHPLVFEKLVEGLGVEKEGILYVGDDPEPDILGASQAGLRPIWMTYVRDNQVPVLAGLGSGQSSMIIPSVPKISNWNEFLILLQQL